MNQNSQIEKIIDSDVPTYVNLFKPRGEIEANEI